MSEGGIDPKILKRPVLFRDPFCYCLCDQARQKEAQGCIRMMKIMLNTPFDLQYKMTGFRQWTDTFFVRKDIC